MDRTGTERIPYDRANKYRTSKGNMSSASAPSRPSRSVSQSLWTFLKAIHITDITAWHREPLVVAGLYASIALVAYWELNIPSPGVATTALALAAGVMTFRGELAGKEKIAWL